eukprot:TRINITY_DN30946_c0_g1_i1.p1 TRINITY_DN30946_c0_g1~~TRINITY_DN30946_c0_g1_i1.p1  ORF type:complete len:765 (-),score=112.44 TRINITY_DN30946_c0_g1_i1:53-2347(-)
MISAPKTFLEVVNRLRRKDAKAPDLSRLEETVDAMAQLITKCRGALEDAKNDMEKLRQENIVLHGTSIFSARARTEERFEQNNVQSSSSWQEDVEIKDIRDAQIQPVPPGTRTPEPPEGGGMAVSDDESASRISKHTVDFRQTAAMIADQCGEHDFHGTSYFKLAKKWAENLPDQMESVYNTRAKGDRSRRNRRANPTMVAWTSEADTSIAEALGVLPDDDDGMDHSRGLVCSLPMRPDSPPRMLWDLMSMILVLYDVVVLPLHFLDLPEDSRFLTVMAWVTRLFWTLDMAVSVCSGYVQKNGHVEMQMRAILINYLKGWFLLDVFVVTIDWLEVSQEGNSSASDAARARFVRGSRGFRALRMLRLLRLLRVGNLQLISGMFELSTLASEKMHLGFTVFKIVLALLAITHFIGCCWWGLGTAVADAHSTSWIRVNALENASIGEKYVACIHWSFAQFVGGMDEFVPAHPLERIFAIAVLVFTFMVSLIVLGNLTSSMTKLFIISEEHDEGLRVLRAYLSQNRISPQLATRVGLSVKYSLSTPQRISQEDVRLLGHVSVLLRSELYLEIFGRILSHHVFFNSYSELCPQVMRRVCMLAISTITAAKGDIIFSEGERPERPVMYVLTEGDLVYLSYTGRVAKLHNNGVHYNLSHFISEGALWTTWVHLGILKVVDPRVTLLVVDADKFQTIGREFIHTEVNPKVYAANFVKMLNYQFANGKTVLDISMDLSVAMLSPDFEFNDQEGQTDLLFSDRGQTNIVPIADK